MDEGMHEIDDLSEEAFWRKITHVLKRKGKKAVHDALEVALKLYYALRDEDTPGWAKAVIYGALIYFIVPIDLLPDVLPTGYVDDLGTLMTALSTVSAHVKEVHISKAKQKVAGWFGAEIQGESE
jgi:uncharacterized membrane protein YkvA (DUF1232 family)